ncbi:MAG: GtrA-like protein [Candidatus Parcubacteria bacterium]|jgi:putative flippase GtrA
MSRMRPSVFLVVGVCNTATDFLVTHAWLWIWFHASVTPYTLTSAKLVGFLAASSVGFVLHGRYTFSQNRPYILGRHGRILRYAISVLCGLAVNALTTYAASTLLLHNAPFLSLWVVANIGFIIGTLSAVVLNYVLFSLVVWHTKT